MHGGTIDIPKKLILTWDNYFDLCDFIVTQIKGSGIVFTDIIGLARGGLIPAQYIAYKLGVKRVHSFGISTYSDEDKPLDNSQIITYQEVTSQFDKTNKILVVDDIADSGRSLIKCINYNIDFEFSGGYKVCTLHYKPTSKYQPDFYASKITEPVWIVYPYDQA